MSREIHGAPIVRCLLVWLTTTTALSAVLIGLGPELTAARGLADPDVRASVRFESLLGAGGAVVLASCVLWFWLATSIVVGQAVTGRLRSVRGCPDGVRRVVLAVCGIALAASATVAPAVADSTAGRPAAATDSQLISGLPLPDRATAPPPAADHVTARPRPSPQVGEFHVVRTGDTLWTIAEHFLPAAARDPDVDRYWRDIWAGNRNAIGPDPHLIHPGTVLHLPSAPKEY